MVVCVWLPNGCTWIFQISFSKAIPFLLAKIFIKSIILLVRDSYSWEFLHLYIEMNKYISFTIWMICNFNMVRKGSDTHGPTQSDFKKVHESHYKLVIIIFYVSRYTDGWKVAYLLNQSKISKNSELSWLITHELICND